MLKSNLLQKYSQLVSHYFFNETESKALKKFGIFSKNVCKVEQVHGNRILEFNDSKVIKPDGFDGMITDKSIYLQIRTADCMPVFLFVPDKKIVCALHAGWKGLMVGIISNAIDLLLSKGVKVKDIICVIGPHIGNCCYDVPYARIKTFQTKDRIGHAISEKREDRWYLDIGSVAVNAILTKGIKRKNIDNFDVCTKCNKEFASFRRDKDKSGRNISVIRLIN